MLCRTGGPRRCPRSAGLGWSPWSSAQLVAGAGAGGFIDSGAGKSLEVPRATSQSPPDVGGAGEAFPRRREPPCLAPSSSLLPLLGYSLPSLLPPSLLPPFCCPGTQPETLPPVLQGRGERLSSPDWEDSVQMSITCEFWPLRPE